MKRVLRYGIAIDDQPHEVPTGVPVLFARTERNRLTGLEALVDVWFEQETPDDWPASDYDSTTQQVQIVGTGHPVPSEWRWLSSFLDGPLVWHLYQVVTP